MAIDEKTPSDLRARLVAAAVKTWTNQLVDVGGRNNLLYFKHLKRGTLDLSGDGVDPSAMTDLQGSKPVRLSKVAADEQTRVDFVARAKVIHARAKENAEEKGLDTLYLASQFATWATERNSARPNAPILLRRVSLQPTGSLKDDFEIELADEYELNPTLAHVLNTDFGLGIDTETILQGASSPGEAIGLVCSACSAVPGFSVDERLAIGNFSYVKLPIVRDLERSQDVIAENLLLSAIAGDPNARDELRDRQARVDIESLSPQPPPDQEFAILDTDSSQGWVIAGALAGSNLVVVGPPGTGKSQTIANLVTTLVARGKSILFVAEKRAAIEAVTERLHRSGLDELVLDLHGGARERKKTAEALSAALGAIAQTTEPDLTQLHRRMDRRRKQLDDYQNQLHEVSPIWGVSPYWAQNRMLELSTARVMQCNLSGSTLEGLPIDRLRLLLERIEEFFELGGPQVIGGDSSGWDEAYAAGKFQSDEEINDVLLLLDNLTTEIVPTLQMQLNQVAPVVGAAPLESLADAISIVTLLQTSRRVEEDFDWNVFQFDLASDSLALAPAHRGWLGRMTAAVFNASYGQSIRRMKSVALREMTSRELHDAAVAALAIKDKWTATCGEASIPVAYAGQEALETSVAEARKTIKALIASTGMHVDTASSLRTLSARLSELSVQRRILPRFPDLHRLETSIREAGLGPLLDEACEAGLTPDETVRAIERTWTASVLQRLEMERSALATFDSAIHEKAAQEYARTDVEHLKTTAGRIRRAWAAHATHARNAHPDQADLISRQATLRRRHLPLRELFTRASEVLTAVKPCWVMSPLVVAQALPPRAAFDVVVFDEASQILPADAVSALLRGKQAIVAGDPHQLPPTSFFIAGVEDESDEDYDLEDAEDLDPASVSEAKATALTSDRESVLDVMRALLPNPYGTRDLLWHYRSKDERLITFSNSQPTLYDWSLKTFPGALGEECIRHVLAPFDATSHVKNASPGAEVRAVVDLIIEHAIQRPEKSLGVVAFGLKHAERIQEALDGERGLHPELETFFAEDVDEPFFVKNLERVQGDERDAVILTVGYGRLADGRVGYNFGPLNQPGGQRRLNVAVTRARYQMTVVSSVTGRELDPGRLKNVGVQMLRDYLLFAESGGTNLGVRTKPKIDLNPFERDVMAHLAAAGIPLTPQYGQSRYWIDFAAMHPERLGEPVLAIETDGAQYHSAPATRDRDRLRQQHLERLGWHFHRIWSTDWFRRREQEVGRAVDAFRMAVQRRDATPLAVKESEPRVVNPASPPNPGRAARPKVQPGYSITEYDDGDLRVVVAWIKSDGLLRTDRQNLAEAARFLGFKKLGSRIVDAIQRAIDAER